MEECHEVVDASKSTRSMPVTAPHTVVFPIVLVSLVLAVLLALENPQEDLKDLSTRFGVLRRRGCCDRSRCSDDWASRRTNPTAPRVVSPNRTSGRSCSSGPNPRC